MSYIVLFISFLCLMTATAQEVPSPEGPPNIVSLNNEAVQDLSDKEGDSEEGYKILMQALESDPFNPVVRLNIGIYQ